MDWDDVRHFLALARLGSIRAAGASLGVSHSTVARRVEALEVRLAARLFDRSRDGYTLTEAGRQMLGGAERVEREIATLERSLVGQDERLAGAVAITCADNYVASILMGPLADFCAQHPEIELSFKVDSRNYDLSKREADIAVRVLARDVQPPEHLIGIKLAPVVMGSYVAVAHAERLDPEREGNRPRWVCYDDRRYQQAVIAESSYPHLPMWGGFGSIELMVQAAYQGMGLVMLPAYVGDRDPKLQRLAKPDLRHLADLWLLTHPDLRDNARFRAARACVAETMKCHEAFLAFETVDG